MQAATSIKKTVLLVSWESTPHDKLPSCTCVVGAGVLSRVVWCRYLSGPLAQIWVPRSPPALSPVSEALAHYPHYCRSPWQRRQQSPQISWKEEKSWELENLWKDYCLSFCSIILLRSYWVRRIYNWAN